MLTEKIIRKILKKHIYIGHESLTNKPDIKGIETAVDKIMEEVKGG